MLNCSGNKYVTMQIAENKTATESRTSCLDFFIKKKNIIRKGINRAILLALIPYTNITETIPITIVTIDLFANPIETIIGPKKSLSMN